MSGPSERWVVTQPEPLGALLERRGAKPAVSEGRVFVDGRRALCLEQALEPGNRVEVFPARSSAAQARILHREGAWVFAEKPAGIATEPEKRGGSTCVIAQVAAELGLQMNQVHALSRLDVGVSGVVLLALDAAARRAAMDLRAAGRIQRRYVALGTGSPRPESGEWQQAIGRSSAGPRREVSATGQAARTLYRVVDELQARSPVCVLSLEPVTGRTHQLRVHAAAHGVPLLGDSSYGGPRRWVLANGQVIAFNRVLLHAAWVKLPDLEPVMSPLPTMFSDFWQQLGGDAGSLRRAVADPVSGAESDGSLGAPRPA